MAMRGLIPIVLLYSETARSSLVLPAMWSRAWSGLRRTQASESRQMTGPRR